ncbi:MAG: hypothetical protein K9J13_05560 [Saprospiraceae bacterium]|nr:hypothetical protein [Saprospiraceae bacterium]
MRVILSIIFSTIILASCNYSKNNTIKGLDDEFITSYNKLDENCKDSIISILFPFQLNKGREAIKHIYQLEVSLIKDLWPENLDSSEILFFGLIWNDDSSDLNIIGIFPKVDYCEVHSCFVINWNEKNELFFHTGHNYGTTINPIINSECFNIPKHYLYDKGIKQGKPLNEYPYYNFGDWHSAYDIELSGEWGICEQTNYKFDKDIYNNIWKFPSKYRFEVYDSNENLLLEDSIFFSSDTMFLYSKVDTFVILSYKYDLLLIKSCRDNSKNCLKRTSGRFLNSHE